MPIRSFQKKSALCWGLFLVSLCGGLAALAALSVVFSANRLVDELARTAIITLNTFNFVLLLPQLGYVALFGREIQAFKGLCGPSQRHDK